MALNSTRAVSEPPSRPLLDGRCLSSSACALSTSYGPTQALIVGYVKFNMNLNRQKMEMQDTMNRGTTLNSCSQMGLLACEHWASDKQNSGVAKHLT